MPSQTPVQLLWTGGWDSTYRLLMLLLDRRVPVQPNYLYDRNRPSAPIETQTMDRLREAIVAAHPHTRELLLPTRIQLLEDIPPDIDIEQAFNRVLRANRIGDQYAFISRFCKQHDMDGVELSVESAPRGASAALAGHVEQQHANGGSTWRLRPDDPDADLRLVFGRCAFPIYDTTKPQMAANVQRNGWSDLMGMTWFCHKPSKDLRPCGFCNPCQYALQQGFGYRIPRSRRALSRLYSFTLMPLRARTRQWLHRMRAQA